MRTAADVIDRLKAALHLGSDSNLSRDRGIPKTTISGWRSRDAIPYELCVQVSDETGVSLDWLLFGVENPGVGVGADAKDGDIYLPISCREAAVLGLYRELDEDSQQEIRTVAEEKKRLRDVERELKELRAALGQRASTA